MSDSMILTVSPESLSRAIWEVKNNVPDKPVEMTGPETGNDMLLAKNAADLLETKYPDGGWLVSIENGLMCIQSLCLSGTQGYYLHVDKLDNDYQKIMRAGGEVYERFRISRERKMSFEDRLCLDRDRRGNYVADE